MFSGLQVRGGPVIVNKEASDEEASKVPNQVADPAYPSNANEQVEVHDGPARAGKTDSSAGALEAPAKTNMVNGSVEVQAVPANTGTLGGMIGALEESKGHTSGYGTKCMPSNMGGSP